VDARPWPQASQTTGSVAIYGHQLRYRQLRHQAGLRAAITEIAKLLTNNPALKSDPGTPTWSATATSNMPFPRRAPSQSSTDLVSKAPIARRAW